MDLVILNYYYGVMGTNRLTRSGYTRGGSHRCLYPVLTAKCTNVYGT
ncbi:MAG: hypothetical protein ACUVX8_15875 [Candidatus Zipacnadales bacterium]